MNKQSVFTILLTLLALGASIVVIRAAPGAQALLNSPLPHPAMFNSPLPTPTPVPPSGPSSEAQRALVYIAEHEGIAIQDLVIVNEFRREGALLQRTFQAVTVLDLKSGRFFQLLVDRQSGQVEDAAAIERVEEQAKQARYGKLQPALHERLQGMRGNETVRVMIWAAAGPGQSFSEREAAAIATLAAKYPQAQAALERGGKPMDVDDPELAERIYAEYVDLLDHNLVQRVQPLVEALEAQGVTVRTSDGLPVVTASLTKAAILQLAQRDDVGAIYLSEGGQFHRFLNSAIPSNLAPTVWARGYDGTGVDIAILEDDNVDFTSNSVECPAGSNNCFQHPGATQAAINGEDWHATLVASAAASNHPTYRGMAPGATIMSAGMLGSTRQDSIDALNWAFNQGAEVVNLSGGWCTDTTQMDVVDRAFDHYARSRLRLIVVAAGERPPCPNDNVASPAKGWNVLSVGAYDDRNDANWGNDVMANWSAWVNPDSPSHDREKPEVVAPGVSIRGVEMNGNLRTADGTSFSAPQVSGLAALLIDRNGSLDVWPEASRAIIMASAAHNIVGPSGIPTGQDLHDGAGGINAALADTTAENRNFSDVDPCTASCWWGFPINNTNFPTGTYLYRYFTANQGDFIRVAIAWWSSADCSSVSSCNYDRLDTDLHLGVYDPDFQWVPGAWSAGWDNNYELVEFVAPKTGTYRIAVYKNRADETSNYLGLAFVRLHRVYLPAVMKNFPYP